MKANALYYTFIAYTALSVSPSCYAGQRETTKETVEVKNLRGLDYAQAESYIAHRRWREAQSLLENICRTNTLEKEISWLAGASFLLACINEKQGELSIGKDRCVRTLKLIDRAINKDSRAANISLLLWKCQLLQKSADFDFYSGRNASAIKNIVSALEICKNDEVRKQDPLLFIELLHRRALMIESSNPALADKLFKQAFEQSLVYEKQRLKVHPTEVKEGESTIPVFKGDNCLVTDSQVSLVTGCLKYLPAACQKRLSQKGYFVVTLEASETNQLRTESLNYFPILSPTGVFNPSTKAIFIRFDDNAHYDRIFAEKIVLHELGHALDDCLGDPSQTEQFFAAHSADVYWLTGTEPKLNSNCLTSVSSLRESFAEAAAEVLQAKNRPLLADGGESERERWNANARPIVEKALETASASPKRFPTYKLKEW